MTIRVRCPGCNTEYALADPLAGKKVRCKQCQAVIAVPDAADALAPPAEARLMADPPRGPDARPPAPPRDAAAAAVPVRKGNGLMLGLILGGAGLLMLTALACAGVGAFFLFRGAAAPAPADREADGKPAPAQDGPPPAEAAWADPAPFHPADVRKSVVLVRCTVPGLGPQLGSGFLASRDGLVVTNRHVVQPEGAAGPGLRLMVGVPSPEDPERLDYFKAVVAYCAPEQPRDVAVLKIAAKPGRPAFRPLALAADKPALGAPVAALGYPGGRGDDPLRAPLSFTKGALSATAVPLKGATYLEADAALDPGGAGGPLINADGAVVGVVTLTRADARPATYALRPDALGLAGLLCDDKLARVAAEPGPADAPAVPAPVIIPCRAAHWDVAQGRLDEEAHSLVASSVGVGSDYWMTSKEAIPENFRLEVRGFVPALAGRNKSVQGDRHFYLRFDTDETAHDIGDGGGPGTTLLFAPGGMSLWNRERSAFRPVAAPTRPFDLSVRRQGGDVTVSVDGQALLQLHLERPATGSHKISIGGRISYPVLIGDVTVFPDDEAAAHPAGGMGALAGGPPALRRGGRGGMIEDRLLPESR